MEVILFQYRILNNNFNYKKEDGMKNIQLTDEDYTMLKELCNLRKTQDNRSTRNPIWLVQTQEYRVCNPDYSQYKYVLHDEEGNLIKPTDNFESFKSQVREYIEESRDDIDFKDEEKYGDYSFEKTYDFETIIEWIENYRIAELNYSCFFVQTIEHYYRTVAYFLTDKEAKKYLKYQAHNLTNPRTYVDYCGYSNLGYLPKVMDLFSRIEFK